MSGLQAEIDRAKAKAEARVRRLFEQEQEERKVRRANDARYKAVCDEQRRKDAEVKAQRRMDLEAHEALILKTRERVNANAADVALARAKAEEATKEARAAIAAADAAFLEDTCATRKAIDDDTAALQRLQTEVYGKRQAFCKHDLWEDKRTYEVVAHKGRCIKFQRCVHCRQVESCDCQRCHMPSM